MYILSETYVRTFTAPQLYTLGSYIYFHMIPHLYRDLKTGYIKHTGNELGCWVQPLKCDQSSFNSYQIVSHCVQAELSFTEYCLLSTMYSICLVCYLHQIYGLTESFHRFALWINQPTTWRRHPMETFSALLAICAGNSPVTGEFPTQRPVTRSFDVFSRLVIWDAITPIMTSL